MATNDPTADETPMAGGGPSRPDGGDVWHGLQPVPTPDTADRPYRSVGFTVSTIGYAIARRFRDRLAPLGLRPRDFALLHSVATTEGVTQQVIAERMRVAPSRMVAFVDSLEERGLLERRPNPDDRRARALFLTQEGRELLRRAFAVPTEQEELLTSELSDNEREQLLDLLGRVGSQVGVPPGIGSSMGHAGLADE
jgi:DNA-binding MarR family transcriptional regulator